MVQLPDGRRSRYRRQEQGLPHGVTPQKLQLLRYLGTLGFASTGQLADLLSVSAVAARRHLRKLFDAGLVRVVPCARHALAGPSAGFDPSLLYGSAPNVYVLDRAGERLLQQLDGRPPGRPPDFGPASSPFLGHELAVRDLYVWLERAARERPGHRLEAWRHGRAAWIGLGPGVSPATLRPDAWFAYRLGGRALVGLAEVDRGTEGALRWKEKVAAFRELFAGGRLRAATGYCQARVLVTVPDGKRRSRLCRLVSGEAGPDLAGRFWFACHGDATRSGLAGAVWERSGAPGLGPLVDEGLLDEAAPGANGEAGR